MFTKDAITHFGGRGALAKALGISPESTYDWGDHVPPLRQFQLEVITKGALQAEERLKRPSGSSESRP